MARIYALMVEACMALRRLCLFASCKHMNTCQNLEFPDSTELVFCRRCGRILSCTNEGERRHNPHLLLPTLDYTKRHRAKILAAGSALAVLMCVSVASADCGQFFRQYRQTYYAPTYVQPAYYAQAYYVPTIQYRAGQDIEAEALAEKVARKVTEKLSALQVRQQTRATVLSAKCAKCHGPSEPKGGVTLDGSLTIDDGAFRRIVEIVGAQSDVPAPMKALVAGLTNEERGAILDEIVSLKPQVASVPPPPEDGGLE